MLVNQKFIAERAGVSQKTVSLYFREPGKIAERTRNRIGTVVRQYHYLPNLAARSIRSRKFNRIACVVMQYGDRSKVIHPHLMAYLNGAASELSAAGYSLLFEPVYVSQPGFKVHFPEFFDSISVDGIIGIPGSWIPPEINARVRQLELPTVWLNCRSTDAETVCLEFDEAAGVRELVHHLLQQGKRRLAWFGPDFTMDSAVHYSSRDRYTALSAELTAAGGTLVRSVFARFGEQLPSKAAAFAESSGEFDAVICYNFDYRDAILWTLIQSGVNPMGFPLVHFASSWEERGIYDFFDYVMLPEAELGRRGARFILSRLRGDSGEEFLRPPAGTLHIAERSSTRSSL
ncbi:LacI family DNA-binding transcriptional regulator [uncultured Victivallis sp.]|uniref:LacI family DNA-binding transcriptional regulator n=1 Tax=uncultured Victivallis sp. TaxID=354118 RepID=UPI0025DD7B14|nr:LacI family DNA-binding transcriptional regulator [uncultured Victivallis sp.]